jgi:hypothetical protein
MAPSKNKYRAELTAEDVRIWAEQLRCEYGITAVITVRLTGSDLRTTAIVVELWDGEAFDQFWNQPRLSKQYGGFPTKSENPWPAIMHICALAWSAYYDTPWLWTRRHRRAVLNRDA